MIPPQARIALASQPVDFRKGLDGLAALVRDAGSDPFLGPCLCSALSALTA